jgi:hypothetical protein
MESGGEFASSALAIILGIATGIAEHTPELVQTITDLLISMAMMLTDPAALVTLIDAGLQIILALATALVDALPQLIDAAPTIVENLAAALVDATPQLVTVGAQLVMKLLQGVTNAGARLLNAGGNIIFIVLNGITDSFARVIQTGASIVDKVKSGFQGKVAEAKTWGKDMIDNFIGGIKERWEKLKTSITDVAQLIKDLLGFSEPKEGPLSNFHTYAPDMMDLFAQRVREDEHVVRGQIEKSFDFGEKTVGFASSSMGRTSSAQINSAMMMHADTPTEYTVNLNVDGTTMAQVIFDPLRSVIKQKGEPLNA